MIFRGKDSDAVKSILDSYELLREEWVRYHLSEGLAQPR